MQLSQKPDGSYFAKYMAGLDEHTGEKDVYVYIFPDKVQVDAVNRKNGFTVKIPYASMNSIEKLDFGKRIDLENVIGLGIVGLYGDKRQPVLIRYTDKGLEKSMLLDFRANTGYAYFHIYERFRKAKSLA
jgi:hypothetical protein